jgi:hypothetical protein
MAYLKEENLSPTEWRRRLRHLLSRQLFALRMLGLPLDSPVLAPARSYIDTAVSEVLKPGFLEGLGTGREGLGDFPISQDCWRMLWSDGNRGSTPNRTLTLIQRSRYAYAAARSSLSKNRSDGSGRDAWDEPWIAYFTQTRPEDIEPKQIVAPLNAWWSEYGFSEEASQAFGGRVLNMQPHAQQKKNAQWQERWLGELGETSGNLWRYVTHIDPTKQLVGPPVAAALRIIASIALRESLPAWRFVNQAGPNWLNYWPRFVLSSPDGSWPASIANSSDFVASEWRAFGGAVVGHKASWIAMLASLSDMRNDDARLARVRDWLRAYEALARPQLHDADPENLVRNAQKLPLTADFLKASELASLNSRNLLTLRNDRGYALYGYYGDLFMDLRDQLWPATESLKN